MNKKFIFFSLGTILEILAVIMFIPAIIAFFEIGNQEISKKFFDFRLSGFIIAIISSFICGIILRIKGNKNLTGSGIREGFAIVTFGWFLATLFGALPLLVYFLATAE